MAGTAIWTGPNAAQFDGNQVPSLMAVVGSVGTADTRGTSAPVRVGADPSTGALYVYNLGPAGSVSQGNIPGGTIGSILGIGGTVQVSGASAGTNVNIVTGTINAATISGNIGTLSMLSAGTLTTIPNTPGGTLGLVTTLSNLTNGSINVTAGTEIITSGSITVTAGTINVGTVSMASAGTGTVSVATVTTSFATVVASNTARHSVIITHQSPSGTVYLGFGTAVTTATGFPVLGNQIVGWNDYTGPIYAIASSGTINTNYVED